MKDCFLIKIWHFADAPPSLQELSGRGGDEDWIVIIPSHLVKEATESSDNGYLGWPWLRNIDCMQEPESHTLDDGSIVLIGGH